MTNTRKQARNLRAGDVVTGSTVEYVYTYKDESGLEITEIHFVRGMVERVPARTRFTA